MMQTATERYTEKVALAQKCGFSNEAIVQELRRERESIMPRCSIKQATLVHDRTQYKMREAARAARECIAAIDKICEELENKEKEITV